MIISPSIILLQPHVGRFLGSDQAKMSIACGLSGNVWPCSGGIAACRLLNSGCLALCMGVEQVDEHSQHDYKSIHHTFTATCGQVSCLRSGKNPDFLPTLRQCLAIKWGYSIM